LAAFATTGFKGLAPRRAVFFADGLLFLPEPARLDDEDRLFWRLAERRDAADVRFRAGDVRLGLAFGLAMASVLSEP